MSVYNRLVTLRTFWMPLVAHSTSRAVVLTKPTPTIDYGDFYSAMQCSHCKRCTINFVRMSVCPSVTRRYCVKTTARSKVQFAISDRKMCLVFSERELRFTFAICYRPSVCRLSVVCSVRALCQAVQIFGNFSTALIALAICWRAQKIVWRSFQMNPSVGGVKPKRGSKYSDFGPIEGYISETVQDRR